ncbi:MAG TPA: phosphatidylglycerophosphatase A [Caldimonas sp.]|nr:phosphatidylglycerophosphatase A [Caldimonas sp.]
MTERPGFDPPVAPLARRPGVRFLLAHPAHLVALGFGSGLAPFAPGTAGTAWAWLAYALLRPYAGDVAWAAVVAVSLLGGWWACTVAARHLAVGDPSAVVWDEIVAFWIVLWLITPASPVAQLVAFALFRFFDAAKPGPVAWADGLFPLRRGVPIGWRQGLAIMLDDLVAALCTLLVIALWKVW